MNAVDSADEHFMRASPDGINNRTLDVHGTICQKRRIHFCTISQLYIFHGQFVFIPATQQMIRGKWKLMILWLLRQEPMRFTHLMAAIPNVKQGTLTGHLKELVVSGLVIRTAYDEMPPHVDYRLTAKGESYLQLLKIMDEWAKSNLFL